MFGPKYWRAAIQSSLQILISESLGEFGRPKRIVYHCIPIKSHSLARLDYRRVLMKFDLRIVNPTSDILQLWGLHGLHVLGSFFFLITASWGDRISGNLLKNLWFDNLNWI